MSSQVYYNTIRDKATLARASAGKATLASLKSGPGWKAAVNQWGREQLFAHRVVCSGPEEPLSLLKTFFPQNPIAADKCIADLVKGPESIDALKSSSELQILKRHQPDSLGYVWAAFLPFVRPATKPGGIPAVAPSTPRQKRDRKAPERYGAGVPSDQMDLDSSPDDKQRPATSSSDSSYGSVGYMEGVEAPLLEDATVRLASCFIRCVLNYAQPVNNSGLILEFRDERLHYAYELGSCHVHAVDDGGVQFFDSENGNLVQVAQLEGKRTFQKIVNGEAVITDELLAQLVGEALALALQPLVETKKRPISRTDFVTILVATHCVRFFHFHVPQAYKESYSNAIINPRECLQVNSTRWLDIKDSDHRKAIASHLLALVAWAQHLGSPAGNQV